jgi:hypothetical protein
VAVAVAVAVAAVLALVRRMVSVVDPTWSNKKGDFSMFAAAAADALPFGGGGFALHKHMPVYGLHVPRSLHS